MSPLTCAASWIRSPPLPPLPCMWTEGVFGGWAHCPPPPVQRVRNFARRRPHSSLLDFYRITDLVTFQRREEHEWCNGINIVKAILLLPHRHLISSHSLFTEKKKNLPNKTNRLWLKIATFWIVRCRLYVLDFGSTVTKWVCKTRLSG